MIEVRQGKNITLTQGDTLKLKVSIKTKKGHLYTPGENDIIRFALKNDYNDKEPMIVKQIPKETLLLRVEASETKLWKARKKPYVYDIQIRTPDVPQDTIDTFISGELIVIPEVD